MSSICPYLAVMVVLVRLPCRDPCQTGGHPTLGPAAGRATDPSAEDGRLRRTLGNAAKTDHLPRRLAPDSMVIRPSRGGFPRVPAQDSSTGEICPRRQTGSEYECGSGIADQGRRELILMPVVSPLTSCSLLDPIRYTPGISHRGNAMVTRKSDEIARTITPASGDPK